MTTLKRWRVWGIALTAFVGGMFLTVPVRSQPWVQLVRLVDNGGEIVDVTSGFLHVTGSMTVEPGTGDLDVNIQNGSTTDTEDGSIATGQSSVALVAGLQMYYDGTAWVRVRPSPCSNNANVVFVPIDIVTATTTEVVGTASGASNYIYICSINLVTAAANNVALVEDDTDACASPTAGIAGGVTAGEGWNFAANGGLTLGNGSAAVAKSAAANRYVCLITSAAVQLSGSISYALAP